MGQKMRLSQQLGDNLIFYVVLLIYNACKLFFTCGDYFFTFQNINNGVNYLVIR